MSKKSNRSGNGFQYPWPGNERYKGKLELGGVLMHWKSQRKNRSLGGGDVFILSWYI